MPDEKVFKPRPGQTDYTNARWAPVVSCVLKHGDKILIVKRSHDMKIYPNLWNGIGGFLDDEKSLEEKIKEELEEETGISGKEIISIRYGEVFDLDDSSIGKTWVIHPALVEISTDKIVLDWEAEEYRWIEPKEVLGSDVAAGFERVVGNFFNLENN
ncbi:MAG TPA: NUDIX domain-containing protein [Candidatus Paceibacterota bacterium]|nr:NUDIX domain-containing protein [Candidatus Paceibacterota bacterium]